MPFFMLDTTKNIIIYHTHIEVHEDRVVLSGMLLCSGYSLSGYRPIGKAHQNLENVMYHQIFYFMIFTLINE